MQIISFAFFGLVVVTYLLLYIIGKAVKNDKANIKVSNIILLTVSYAFLTYADYRFVLVLLMLTVVTWLCARWKKTIVLGVILAILVLAFFKYTNFFAESFVKLFGNDFTAINIILPVGVSFYTFSAISYLLDVKRERIEVKNLFDVALYLAFFPKLTSGPIQRSGEFFTQAENRRNIGAKNFSVGIQIFVFGLFKKIVLADRLSVFVDQVYATPKVFSSMTVSFAVIAYSLQIYFDFSGYSDMAIGVAKLLGFDLPRNFNLPYIAHNVTELWKRWHITLSSWLQDYVYISLGGNRKGKVRTYLNLILTMVIGGFWHGANWTFMIWGLLHGVALAVHKVWMLITKSKEKTHSIFANGISILITFVFTTFCWIFFRADTLSDAVTVIQRIFSFECGVEQPYLWFFVSVVILIGSTVAAFVKYKKTGKISIISKKVKNVATFDGFYPIMNLNKFWGIVVFLVFVGLTIGLAYTGKSPFIYGNF